MDNDVNQEKKISLSQIILLLLIAVGVIGLILPNIPGGRSGGEESGGGAAEAETVAVATATLEKQELNQYLKVNGDVVLETSVDLFATVSGKLISRPIAIGDYISSGQIIARVDPSLPGQVYSTSAVRSTIDGTVTSIPVHVGDTISPQSPIATVGDLQNLLIQTYIPERFIASLRTGLQAELIFDAFPDEVFSASIVEMNPVMDSATRTLGIKLEMDRKDSRIRVGMFTAIRLIISQKEGVLAVPQTALFSYYGDPAVYVIDGGNTAHRRRVVTGLRSDDRIEVSEGLAEGERIVIRGLSSVTDGASILSIEKE